MKTPVTVVIVIAAVLVLLVLAGVIIPTLNSAHTSGPRGKKAAVWVRELIDEIVSEADRVGGSLPRSGSELRGLVARSESGFLAERSILYYEDISAGVIKIHIDTPLNDFKELLYEVVNDEGYRVSLPEKRDEDRPP